MYILYRCKQFRFSISTLFTLYTWFITTSLEYAVPVWHSGISSQQSMLIERIQKRCFRIILGNQYNDYDSALLRFKTTTLEKRRIKLCYKFAQAVMKSPRHRHLLPQTFREVHDHDTRGHRGGRRMPSVKCTRARYNNSSVPYLVRLLNADN